MCLLTHPLFAVDVNVGVDVDFTEFRGLARMKNRAEPSQWAALAYHLRLVSLLAAQRSASRASRIQRRLEVVGIAAHNVKVSVHPPTSLYLWTRLWL